MAKTFFFYDLETSGLNSRSQRIMQFAGQRTDMDLKPIGEPIDVLVKLSEDILPEPYAILVTGTTPQKTLQEGISEPEFVKMFIDDVATPETIMVGFNTIRFDDEFMRHTLWRNFYDPYEWSWSEGRSRWDMLDVVRMTRALRPDGINWPVNEEGEPVNKLELLSKANNLEHEHAHDALSDVEATIGVAKLIRQKQPKLFEWLLRNRDKKEVAKIVNLDDPKPFVYSSGRYGRECNFTTIAIPIAFGSRPGSIVVYDLRYDPSDFSNLTSEDIKQRIFANYETRKTEGFQKIPVKELVFNKCPAVAPLGVMSEDSWENINLAQALIEKHLKVLNQDFADKVAAAYADRPAFEKSLDVEEQLYDGFVDDKDRKRMDMVRKSSEQELADFHPQFADERLPELLIRYKARWFPKSLSHDEQLAWENYRQAKLQAHALKYQELIANLLSSHQEKNDQFLLEELRLWLEYIAPLDLES